MNKKLLVGFQINIDVNINPFNDEDINIKLLNKIRKFSQKHFNVCHTIYIERDKIQLFCTTKDEEVPLKSRGKDNLTKNLIKNVSEKYEDLFFKGDYKEIRFEVYSMYFKFREIEFYIYKDGSFYVSKELCNTKLWYDYYGEFQSEIGDCMGCSKCILEDDILF